MEIFREIPFFNYDIDNTMEIFREIPFFNYDIDNAHTLKYKQKSSLAMLGLSLIHI